MRIDFRKILPHLAALVIFTIISSLYFFPQFEGKKIPQGDLMQWEGMVAETKAHKKNTGEDALWTNGMFSGMPTYQIAAPQKTNIFQYVDKVLNLGISRPTGYFIFGAIGFYILLLAFGVNSWLAIFGALAFSLITNNLILYEAGHATKLKAIMASPYIIAGLRLLFSRKYYIGTLVFTAGMGLNLMANHYQMTYYLALVLVIYAVIEGIAILKSKDWRHLGILTGAVIFGCFVAVASSGSKFFTTYEYSKDTMRGEPILSKTDVSLNSSSQVNGLDWEYAMAWSNGWIDLAASAIAGVAGGSSSEKLDKDSGFAKILRQQGNRNLDEIDLPLYWGDLPFTSGPIYFGFSLVFLFILGAFIVKDKVKWWIISATILTLILSMGKNMAFINEAIFHYFPMYNKFRTPNSVLSVTSVIVPILSMLAVMAVINYKDKEELWKYLKYTGIITGGFCIFFILIGPNLFDFVGVPDESYKSQGLDLNLLMEDRKNMMRNEAMRALILGGLLFGAIYLFIRGKVKSQILIPVIGLLILFDMIGVDRRYVNSKDFVPAKRLEASSQPRTVDLQILQDKELSYRVMDLSVNTFNSTVPSFFHKNIGGYHAAKLQRYQDIIDRHISQNNIRVLNMLNTKYVIQPGPNNEPKVTMNPAALGNAWFVNNILMVNSADEEIDALNTFDPAGDAVVHSEFQSYIGDFDPEKNGYIRLDFYSPDKLMYTAESLSDQLAVFSEVWYGPNKGWQAYIDGQPVDHIRVNYVLRGLKVPKGKHEIIFEFKPAAYAIGNTFGLIGGALFLLLAGFVAYQWYREGKRS